MLHRMLPFFLLGLSVCALVTWAAGQNHVITQKDKTFSATELTVKTGETIVFKNDNDVTHNVFSQTAGFEFNSIV